MILYVAFFVLLSMFFLNTSPLFDAFFQLLSIPVGMKSVAIQLGSIIVALTIVFRQQRSHRVLWRELFAVILTWLPWLVYAGVRTDFGDHYATLTFAKIVVVQFAGVLTVSAAFLSNPADFNKYLLPTIVGLASLQLLRAVLNPEVFVYASVVERLTVEDVNPIWLARAFALAAISILFIPKIPRFLKLSGVALFIAAIIPTGSRGPLISLICVLTVYWMMINRRGKGFTLKIFFVGIAAAVGSVAAGSYLSKATSDYLSRGTSNSMFEESGRAMMFGKATNEYLSSPVVGIGLGMFSRGESTRLLRSGEGSYPHNVLLEILSGLGTIGLLLFTLAMRPGKWLFNYSNQYIYFFIVCFLFSMTSGDINANNGLIYFAVLARLNYRYSDVDGVGRKA